MLEVIKDRALAKATAKARASRKVRKKDLVLSKMSQEKMNQKKRSHGASLDCGALDMSSSELNSPNWLKFNYDTGAAVTAFPEGLVESSP